MFLLFALIDTQFVDIDIQFVETNMQFVVFNQLRYEVGGILKPIIKKDGGDGFIFVSFLLGEDI